MKKIELNRAENYEGMTKYFFNSPTPKQFKTMMTSIKHNGVTCRTQDKKSQAARSFFSNLYAEPKTQSAAKRKLLSTITNPLKSGSPEYVKMDSQFTQPEILATIEKLSKGKSPGPDGFISEFYQLFKN